MVATPAKSGYLLKMGNPLNYLEWGNTAAPALVLIHGGLLEMAYSWQLVAERLAQRYRCIALNLTGHGDSGPSLERKHTVDLYLSDVDALVDQLELRRFTLMGHSMGGAIAITYAAAHPDRAQAVVLVESGSAVTEDYAWILKRMMEETPAEFDSWQGAVDFTMRERPSVPPAIMEERAFYHFRRLPNGKVAWKHDPLLREEWLGPGLPERIVNLINVRPASQLEMLQCPLLLVKAQKSDSLTAEICERIVSYGRNRRWAEIPNTGHFAHDDNLEGFLKEVEPFLEEITKQAVI